MKTTSKLNPLTLIIIFSVIIFILAFIWKSNQIDVREKITIVEDLPIEKSIRQQKARTQHTQLPNRNEDTAQYTDKETYQNEKKTSEQKFYNSLYLQTPEDIIKAIDLARNKNNAELEEQYINLLIEKFPDYNL